MSHIVDYYLWRDESHWRLARPHFFNVLCLMSSVLVIESDFDVLRLFYASPLIDIAQRLLGMFTSFMCFA